MSNDHGASSDSLPKIWTVKLDIEACSLCEVCVRHCTAGAMRTETVGSVISLFHNPERCDGCAGAPRCQEVCPEDAIEVVGAEEVDEGAADRPLLQGPLQLCSNCGELFAPSRKITTASSKGAENAERFRDHCPLCRRSDLVVRYIDEKRAPGGKAEYRHGRNLMRKAGQTTSRKTDPPKPPIS